MRFKFGWSIDALARAIGVTSSRLIEFENGEARIEARVMSELCRVLNLLPSTFFAWLPEVSSNATSALGKLEAA
jgi:transcriptional regulator with XRE-family HTH domain